jgi:AcrR family transcriptional regulator
MGRNIEKDAAQMAVKRQNILNSAFRLFAAKGIEKVAMLEVATEAGVGIATEYRYYSTKAELVMAVSTMVWSDYLRELFSRPHFSGENEPSAAERFAYYLDSFLDLYRNHRDLLRFNQFFNLYVQSEVIPANQMDPYTKMIGKLAEQFHAVYAKGKQDGTLKTDMPEKELLSCTLHLMLAAVTRYAVGLVYTDGTNPETELLLLKNMILKEFVHPDALTCL